MLVSFKENQLTFRLFIKESVSYKYLFYHILFKFLFFFSVEPVFTSQMSLLVCNYNLKNTHFSIT
jgi:hypothetical protein